MRLSGNLVSVRSPKWDILLSHLLYINSVLIIRKSAQTKEAEELRDTTPYGVLSLNGQCESTNTNVNGPRPNDHVMFRPEFSREIDREFDMVVVDLIKTMQPLWQGMEAYPGEPYDHNEFRKLYTDHHSVAFRMRAGMDDD